MVPNDASIEHSIRIAALNLQSVTQGNRIAQISIAVTVALALASFGSHEPETDLSKRSPVQSSIPVAEDCDKPIISKAPANVIARRAKLPAKPKTSDIRNE